MDSFNVFEMWQHMGVLDKGVVTLLVVMSVYSLWVMIDRAVVFQKARRQSDAFVRGLKGHLVKRDLVGALALARAESASPVAKVVAAALTEYEAGGDVLKALGPDADTDYDLVD